jgi:acetoin utilization deacetylase AcuC-like enzyme
MKTIYSDKCTKHDPQLYFAMGQMSPYPETPARVLSVLKAIKSRSLGDIIEPLDFGMEPIALVHSKEYIDYLQNAYSNWIKMGGSPNGVIPDTFRVACSDSGFGSYFSTVGAFTFDTAAVITQDTYGCAYEAAQVALTGAHMLVNGATSAFALCRPPGHHSGEALAGGFCFFNNAAIAAAFLSTPNKKVCILDIDYHHFNGTQTIFYNKANPLCVSIHAKDDYPFFWGAQNETGEGDGEGYNFNIPLPKGTGDQAYLQTLQDTMQNIIRPYNPSYLIVSLGVDTFEFDPVGAFNISSQAFLQIGKLINISVPTLFVFEGGYAVEQLGDNVVNVLEGFENATT